VFEQVLGDQAADEAGGAEDHDVQHALDLTR
jgi:hypothetical protein